MILGVLILLVMDLTSISGSIAMYEKFEVFISFVSWNLPAPKGTITRLNVEKLV